MFELRQINFWTRLADGLVNVTGNECHVGDVIRLPPSQPLWELCAGENVMTVYVILKQDLPPPRVEITDAPMHAGYV